MTSAPAHNTVRLFVSSTFRDMDAERDHLVTVVFPELRERLMTLGLAFFDVDLRWGVPDVGVDGEAANSWAYCKRWIDRARPLFIGILGERYGWVPPEHAIEDPADRARWSGRSITEMEVRHALSLQDSATTLFYLRDTSVPPPPLTPAATYNQFVDVSHRGHLADLIHAIEHADRPVRRYGCDWHGDRFTNLEQFGRLVLEDLWSAVLRDEAYVSHAVWARVLGHSPCQDPLYTDASRPVPQTIWQALVDHARPAPRSALDREAAAMSAFATDRIRWFEGREDMLSRLARFCLDDPRALRCAYTDTGAKQARMCVIVAPPGQGKSALLARLTEHVATSETRLIAHFVGAGESSATFRGMLLRLHAELDRSEHVTDTGRSLAQDNRAGDDIETLGRDLAERLERWQHTKRIIFIIDGLEQLGAGADLRWLPTRLAPAVRIVASISEDQSQSAVRLLAAVGARQPSVSRLDLDPLTDADVRGIVTRYLDEYCKALDTVHVERIVSMRQSHNPLFLLVMLGELRILGGDQANLRVPELIGQMQTRFPDTIDLFEWVIERLAVYGEDEVRRWCTYLAISRTGMSSTELCQLLERATGTHGARTALRIERAMRRFLQRRGDQLDFFHGQLRAAVRRRFFGTDVTHFHADIAALMTERWRDADQHALSELPYHQTQSSQFEAVTNTLTCCTFVQSKVHALGPHAVVEDATLALAAMPEGVALRDPVRAMRDTLRVSSHVLASDATQLAGQLIGRLAGIRDPRLEALVDSAHEISQDQLVPLTNSLDAPGSALERTLTGHGQDVALVVLPDADTAVAEGGLIDQTIRAWSLVNGDELAWSAKPGQLLHAARTPQGHRAVVLADDGLDVFDPTTGETVYSLKVDRGNPSAHRDATKAAVTPQLERGVYGSSDGWVTLWDLGTGTVVAQRQFVPVMPSRVDITPDGQHVILAAPDGQLSAWAVDTDQITQGPKVDPRERRRIIFAFTRKGALAGTAQSKERFVLWNVETGKTVLTLAATTLSLPMQTTEDIVATGRDRDTLELWQVSTGTRLREVSVPQPYDCFALSSDATKIAIGADSHVYVLDVARDDAPRLLGSHSMSVDWITFDPQATLLASASRDGTVRIWDALGSTPPESLERHDGAQHVAVSPDGTLVATNSRSEIVLWNAATRARNTVVQMPDATVAFAADSGMYALQRGGGLMIADLQRGAAQQLTLSVNATRMVVPRDANGLVLLGTSDDVLAALIRTHKGWSASMLGQPPSRSSLWCMAISADGRWAASGDDTGSVFVWDVTKGHFVAGTSAPLGAVLALLVSRDGHRVVAGDEGGTVSVHDGRSAKRLTKIDAHAHEVTSLAWLDDERYLLSASWDGTVKIWRMADGYLMTTFTADGRLRECAVSRDSRVIVAVQNGGQLHWLRWARGQMLHSVPPNT